MAYQRQTPVAMAYEDLAVSTAAVSFDATKAGDAEQVQFQIGTQTVRLRYDGTDPTSAAGLQLTTGVALYLLDGTKNVKQARFILDGAVTTAAIVRATFLS
jgi:hypothetical protein